MGGIHGTRITPVDDKVLLRSREIRLGEWRDSLESCGKTKEIRTMLSVRMLELVDGLLQIAK